MADNKKYYYLKLKDNFFDCDEIKVLESQANGIYYSNLLIKLYLKSLKFNGALRFNEYIPYNEDMIATITNLNIDIVRSGLKVLSNIKLIEKLDDGTIYMMNIQSFIGKSNSEADRKKHYRERIEEEKLLLEQMKELPPGQMSGNCPEESGTGIHFTLDKIPPEKETDTKNIDIDKERDRKTATDKRTENFSSQDVVQGSLEVLEYFEILTGFTASLNLMDLKNAVMQHGSDNVKKAARIAVLKNKPTMVYINGILRNWAKEGYPRGGDDDGSRITDKSTRETETEFPEAGTEDEGSLTDEERKLLEDELI